MICMKTGRRNLGAIRLMSAKGLPTANRWAPMLQNAMPGVCWTIALGCVSLYLSATCYDRGGDWAVRRQATYSLLSFHITPSACRIRVSCVVS